MQFVAEKRAAKLSCHKCTPAWKLLGEAKGVNGVGPIIGYCESLELSSGRPRGTDQDK
ncbi:hypothetical protein K443DRAFT_677637 [Laccaria amethystina LaAM-08-1]|uniref:Uncharacterized protein n=1 Tax=Laccaria amethystina LaAM-08-1 TaxID=1095629 RepID=A0A0C9WTM1_9AGAR|nr:hypothetical protein K443DRAFT_677637 [Laccaria amethystina LaAM-08-1]